ncbi:MAG: 3'-5' exoribonuclease YhaM family protein [Clostridiales bacterium]|nr:3'-5' exoribonuclease YhaM family protein [Clostridiales bacterium]
MKYLNEIREGENVVEHYLCKSRQMLKSRAGKSYLSLKLQDKTGVVDAKVWDLNNDIKSFEENEFIKIDAIAIIYQNEIQLNVRKIRRSMEGEYDPVDYIPCTEKNIDEMFQQLLAYIKTIQETHIKKLLESVFITNEKLTKSFKVHSAAKTIHHGYMGGLVEHTLSVTQICDFFSGRYKYVNRDILIACAMLHDIGKVRELSEFPENDYTDEGQLLGHIYIGAQMIGEEAAKIEGFPPKLISLMQHCILSHHGEYEYGSPKLPKTMEAFLLHFADDTDAKVKVVEEMIDADSTQGSWVGYQKMLQRNIRKSDF